MRKLTRKDSIILVATGIVSLSAAIFVHWWVISTWEEKVLVMGRLGLERGQEYYYLEGLGFFYVHRDYRKSLEYFNKAISLAPQGEWTLANGLYRRCAQIHENNGQHDLAIKDANTEIELYHTRRPHMGDFDPPDFDLEYCQGLVGKKEH